MRELTEVDIVHNLEMSCYGFGGCEMITGGIGDDVFDPLLEGVGCRAHEHAVCSLFILEPSCWEIF
jgi:hypothetical protein